MTDDLYRDPRRVQPLRDKGPTEQFLESVADFFAALVGKKKKNTPAPKPSGIPTLRSTTVPAERNMSMSHTWTPPKKQEAVVAPVVDNVSVSGPLVCNPQYAAMTKDPAHHIVLIKHDENKPSIIRNITINIAGANEAPKIVTLGADELARLKKSLDFIDNDLLDPSVSLRGRRQNNDPRPRA